MSRADDSPRVLVPPPLIFVSLAAAGFALDLVSLALFLRARTSPIPFA